MTLPPEIINAIKEDAVEYAENECPIKNEEDYYKDWVDDPYFDYMSRKTIERSVLQSAYISGREEQLEKDLEFILWADDNFFRIGTKDLWTDMIGEEDAKHYTTTELYIEYIKIREGI